MWYILGAIFLLLFSTCTKDSDIENTIAQYLLKNRNEISICLINEEITNELNIIYREGKKNSNYNKIEAIEEYVIPSGCKLLDLYKKKNSMEEPYSRYLVIEETTIPIGSSISKIKAKKDEMGILVTCTLSTEGSSMFFEFTSNNIHRELAMLMRDELIFSANIRRPLKNSINFLISTDELSTSWQKRIMSTN
jgi:preprotein translocase subunit SecD